MQHVRLALEARGRKREVHPMWEILAAGDAVERATGIQWAYTGDTIGMLHYVVGDLADFETAVAAEPSVVDVALTEAGPSAFYAFVRSEATDVAAAMWEPVTGGGVVIVPPIHFEPDGRLRITLFGPETEFSDLSDAVPDPVSVSVEAVGDLAALAGPRSRLSERQREAIRTGLALGYYQTPRAASQADVAAAMECAPSTAAEHLQKAEAALVRSALDR